MSNPRYNVNCKTCLRARERRWRLLTVLLIFAVLPGCIGTVVGAAVDTTIEVAKVPFKVGGAVVDIATGDDEDDD